MKITEAVYITILNQTPSVPPETGGILGQQNGIVCAAVLDQGIERKDMLVYEPRVEVLNEAIQKWSESGITFCGMFHSHPSGQETLSQGDKLYIRKIMEMMPPDINTLFFPLVVPCSGMIGYLAKKKNFGIVIVPEEIKIVKENDYGENREE